MMKQWGTKIIRLGVMWESVETAPGVYDYDYLDKVDALINKFGEYDMVTIVDNHQDLFSRKTCGEGVPVFYVPEDLETRCPFTPLARAMHAAGECIPIKSYNIPLDENGLPDVIECGKHPFTTMYTAPEVASSFAALYDNYNGI